MKPGIITKWEEKPKEGFTISKEGIQIFIDYKENINEIQSERVNEVVDDNDEVTKTEIELVTEYEFTLYSNNIIVDTYEELINKLISLKYTMEDELSMTNKYIEDPDSEKDEYMKYRSYVKLCKQFAKDNYQSLGLLKN